MTVSEGSQTCPGDKYYKMWVFCHLSWSYGHRQNRDQCVPSAPSFKVRKLPEVRAYHLSTAFLTSERPENHPCHHTGDSYGEGWAGVSSLGSAMSVGEAITCSPPRRLETSAFLSCQQGGKRGWGGVQNPPLTQTDRVCSKEKWAFCSWIISCTGPVLLRKENGNGKRWWGREEWEVKSPVVWQGWYVY